MPNLPYRLPDVSRPNQMPIADRETTKRSMQRARQRRQDQFLESLGGYKRARHGWRVALKWQWSTQKCKECGEVRYCRETLRWSYTRKRPDGTWETYSRPVEKLSSGRYKLKRNTKVPAPGPGPEVKCVCPGKRGPRPSTLPKY